MNKSNFAVILMCSLAFTSIDALAWGKRGHQIVGETAALLVSNEPDAGFMRVHSFDFGYYANVPDFMWKKPATYGLERSEHFVNLEPYAREFAKHPEVINPLALSRKEFEAKFPEIKPESGRAYFRVREMNDQLSAVTKELRDLTAESGPVRQKLQEKWLVLAGTMAHYVGDLGMPLHVSENHNGEMTNQKGVHGYFEEVMVDQLYPALETDVNREAAKQWPAFQKKNADKSVLELLQALALRSQKAIPKLLAMDKKSKREELQKNAKLYAPMIRERLVDSTLTLAELYHRQLGWKFDDVKFYFMAGEPDFIVPGVPVVAPAQPVK